jgi:regulator of replication initiation timing
MQEISKVIDTLGVKLHSLLEKYHFLKEENELLRNQLLSLQGEMKEKDSILSQQGASLESLKVAKAIEGSDYSKETVHKIDALVKEIDWCIAQLSS